MIAISAVLVLLAFVTLIIGVFQTGLSMIWVSIGASIAAAVSLALGVVRSRPKSVTVTGPDPLAGWSAASTSSHDDAEDTVSRSRTEDEEEPITQVIRLDDDDYEAPRPRARTTASRSSATARTRTASTRTASTRTATARKTTGTPAKKTTAKTTAAKKTATKSAGPAKKTAVKKSPAKKTAAKKSTARKTAR